MASPEMDAVIEMMRAMPPEIGLDVEASRANLDNLGAVLPVPEGVVTKDTTLGGRPARWYQVPDADPDRVLLYLHGGAYVSGGLDSHAGLCGRIAQATGGRVVAVDYRLGPEHPFPAAVDDARSAWSDLLQDGVDPAKAAIAGDSAGGGLTMAALVALRDAGTPLPAAAIVLSPWTDLACRGTSHQERKEADPMLDADRLLAMAALYLDGADPLDPLASPVEADVTGLPPTLVQVGSEEVLFDDSTLLVTHLQAAGVEARLDVCEGGFHVFPAAQGVPEADQAVLDLAAWYADHSA